MQVKVLDFPQIQEHPGCVAEALSVIGNKWTALIIMELATNGPTRFSALETKLQGISPRTLSQRLDELQYKKMITKKTFAEVPPRVEYCLTNKGADLMPVLRAMADWGVKYNGGRS